MKLFPTILLSLTLGASLLTAAAIPCNSSQTDVTTLTGPTTLAVGPVTYSNARLDFSSDFSAVDICVTNSYFSGGYNELDFSVSTDPASTTTPGAYWRLAIHIDSDLPIWQIRLANTHADGVIIFETVCDGMEIGGSCNGTELGTVAAANGDDHTLTLDHAVSSFDVVKFGQYNDAQEYSFEEGGQQVPEPGSIVYGAGGGLLILVSQLRRHRRTMARSR